MLRILRLNNLNASKKITYWINVGLAGFLISATTQNALICYVVIFLSYSIVF
jgi:hypothetical protein